LNTYFKIKTAFRVFFPKKVTQKENFVNELNLLSAIKSFAILGENFEVELPDRKKIWIRNWNHSDLHVFKQVFINDEYQNVLDLFRLNSWNFAHRRIIDAGANVGYTTILFDGIFQDSTIVCIEPSDSNFRILSDNVSFCRNTIKLYKNALSGKSGISFQLEKNFRDGLDWAHSTSQHKDGDIKGKTIPEIMIEQGFEQIDLLKIDIEGAERFIFEQGADMSFLSKTRLLVIEIHDEFNCRDAIHQILIESGFLLLKFGEMTYAINKTFLN
jgi:FkbM family methyltransferase